jgi:hypothetical protein
MKFRWNDRRDRYLREARQNKFTFAEAGRMVGCTAEEARARWQELRAAAPVSTAAVATVERPVFVPRPKLIDLSKAPSAMEQRFGKGGGE